MTKDEWAEKTTCTKGEYFDDNKSLCVGCRTNNDENLCGSCNGPEPENCIQCLAGYYLDRSNYSC